jgi:uncharacterized protein (TIGR00369 family)
MTQTQDVTQTRERSRTYAWSDPLEAARHLGTTSGLDLLRAMGDGRVGLPPVMATLGVDGFEAEEGRVTFWMTPHEFHYNPLGTVHGGMLSTLLDSACGCSVHSVLPAGRGYTSLDLTVKFLRPVTVASGQLRCVGGVLSRGRTTALAEARLYDGADRLAAYATSSCLLFDTPSA